MHNPGHRFVNNFFSFFLYTKQLHEVFTKPWMKAFHCVAKRINVAVNSLIPNMSNNSVIHGGASETCETIK